ncbi:uncharacterized protein At5g50100, mitochondrial-like [Sinocyclocheilus grahami]|uniref:uncharacterized protein At5g50100, mitochondrial-like n=1 Tax=Sinocyclocheilus grahami TaxID=75366 RepID=UPI0007AD0069|nr:PREDICTED: uncharacterized protein At5g50100, mitochondrial-like [Sinocyclocheilus grahami]
MALRLALVGALRYIGSRTSVVGARRLFCSQKTGQESSDTIRVLYDGECPICVKEISLLQFLERNRTGKVDFVDISLPAYDGSKYGVSYEMAMEEMTVIDEKNTIHRGVPAFTVMYSAVGLGWLGTFISLPLVRPIMDRAYGVFARNRLKWTGREGCTTGRCAKKET